MKLDKLVQKKALIKKNIGQKMVCKLFIIKMEKFNNNIMLNHTKMSMKFYITTRMGTKSQKQLEIYR